MEAINYSSARSQLVKEMEKVCDNHEPVIITRNKARSVVLMSLEDYNAIVETAYLLSNSSNAERLRESIKQAEQGKLIERDILEK